MLNLYEYNSPEGSYLVYVLNSNKYSKIVVFRDNILGVIQGYGTLATNKIAQFADFVDYAVLFNEEKLPYEYSQSNRYFEECLLIKSVLNKLFDGEKDITVSTSDGTNHFNLVATFADVKLTKLNIYKDNLRYETIAADIKTEFGLVKRLSNLATVEDMKKRYDCSWVFKEDGTMIKDYRSITTKEDLEWLKSELEKLPDDHFTGYDVETTGLKIFRMPDHPEEKDRLLGFSLAWKDNQGVYIPLESKVFECLDKETVFSELYDHLLRLHIIAHNGQFEWKVNYDNGRTIEINEDTLLLDFNIFPEIIPGWRTLKNLTRVWFGHETWEFSQLFGGKADPEMLVYLPLDLITIYGCADSDYARMLFFKLKEYLNPSQEFCYRLDVALIELLAKSEYVGIALNMDEVHKQGEFLKQDLLTMEILMEKYIRTYGLELYKERRISEFIEAVKETKADLTPEQLLEFINQSIDDKELEASFTKMMNEIMEKKPFTGANLAKILYELLEYPILQYTKPTKKVREERERKRKEALAAGLPAPKFENKPSTDEETMLMLAAYQNQEDSAFFKDNVISADGKTKLIDSGKLNRQRYPFASMLLEYKRITKLLSAFYNNVETSDSIYLYNENNPAAAATARLISTVQTLPGVTKKNIVALPGTYAVNADYSQIEIRNMAGCANEFWETIMPELNWDELSVYHRRGLKDYIGKLCNPETDIHRETAATICGIEPDRVTKEQRSGAKSHSFGVPYGMGSYASSADTLIKYVDKISENAEDVTRQIVFDSGISLARWSFTNYPIIKFLQVKRKQALMPVEDSEKDKLPPYYAGLKIGYVTNSYGRRRYFKLDDIDGVAQAAIRREAGNYPIQSGSRDLFFINKYNMYNQMKKEGWVHNPTHGESPELDEFTMAAFVHDEFFGFAKLNVHPFKMIRLIYNTCFVNIKYHPTYFMGVNFVNCWYDGKAGTNELPVPLVKSLAETPESEWPEFKDGYFYVNGNKYWVVDYFAQLKKKWELGRVIYEIAAIASANGILLGASTPSESINWDLISDNFKNYSVKALVLGLAKDLKMPSTYTFKEMLSEIWNSKSHDFLRDDIKSSRLEDKQDTKEEQVEEDLFDLFEDESVQDISEHIMSREEQRAAREEEIYNDYLVSTGQIKFNTSVRERDTYVPKNLTIKQDDKVDTRVIMMLSGKLILDLQDISPKYHQSILSDVKAQFEDPNGSVFYIITKLGYKKVPFRVFNLDRNELEKILSKYDNKS